MKKFEEKSITETKEIHTQTVCNKCDKTIQTDTEDNWVEQNMFHEFKTGFGYGSELDMESWNFDLCEDCLLEFVRTFKVMPSGFADESRYPEEVFKKWKETGKLDWKAGWSKEEHDEFEEKQIKHREELEKIRIKLKEFQLQ